MTSPTVASVQRFYAEILDVQDVGPDDDFFELGGDSFAAVQLLMLLREEFDGSLPARLVFESTTCAQLAQAVRGAAGG